MASESVSDKEKDMAAAWEAQVSESPAPPAVEAPKSPQPQLRPAAFAPIAPSAEAAGAPGNLDFVLDLPLHVSVEIGRTRMVIKDLIQLGQGSVIELDKLAGEPMEVYVNEKLVARGEVVVVNEKFGIRLTDIVSPIERIKQLA